MLHVHNLAQFLLTSLRGVAALNYREHDRLGRQYVIQLTQSVMQNLWHISTPTCFGSLRMASQCRKMY